MDPDTATDHPIDFEVDEPETNDSLPDTSAETDFEAAYFAAVAFGMVGGALFMMGWYGAFLAQYVPRVVIGVVATGLAVGGPMVAWIDLRSTYSDVFTELRQIPDRL